MPKKEGLKITCSFIVHLVLSLRISQSAQGNQRSRGIAVQAFSSGRIPSPSSCASLAKSEALWVFKLPDDFKLKKKKDEPC